MKEATDTPKIKRNDHATQPPLRGGYDIKQTLFSVCELEAMSGVSRWTWRRWAYSGKIESVKLGTRLLIRLSAVERIVAENTRTRIQSDLGPSNMTRNS
jgi:excisionase family DNA binding protein